MNRIMWGTKRCDAGGSAGQQRTVCRPEKKWRHGMTGLLQSWKEKLMVWWNGPDEIFYIGGAEVLPPPLTAEEEKTCLFALTFETADAGEDGMSRDEARNRLIAHNLRLVVYLAKKFENTGVGVEDLISIGSIGLIKGINTFNPDKKIKLATYASRCIENEILMYLRRTNKTKLEVSIDEPLNVDWDGNELLLSDILGTEEDVIYRDMENEAELVLLRKAVDKLNPREREIIELRFGLNRRNGKEMTQKEVADILGISQSYISRLEKKIMSRLKKEMLKLYTD
jgi:RNA polymerase sporulation-specific sigma factor